MDATAHMTKPPRAQWLRAGVVVATGVLLLILGFAAVLRFGAFDRLGLVGIDYATHLAFAQRFLDTGSMYLPSQLAGPFDPQPLPHVPERMPSLYPPHAAYLFVPFLALPAVLWWAIPLGIVAYGLYRWRPAWWTWPILAVLFLTPEPVSAVIAGNTMMWLVAFVTAGLLWGWPAVLVTLKPSLLPFALLGIRHRSWWLVAGLVAVASLPLVGQWFAYVDVVRNAQTSLAYSLGSLPVMLAPLVAYLTRSARSS